MSVKYTYNFNGRFIELSDVAEAHRKAAGPNAIFTTFSYPTHAKLNLQVLNSQRPYDTLNEEMLIDDKLVIKCDSEPSFAACKRRGQIVMNPYTNSSTQYIAKTGEVHREVGYGQYIFNDYHAIPLEKQGRVTAIDRNTGNVIYDRTFTSHFRGDVDYSVPLYHGFDVRPRDSRGIPKLDTQNFEEGVYTSLLSAVSSSDFDAATNSAELGETISMFRTMLPKLIDDVLTLKRMYVNIPRKAFKRGLSRREFEKMLKTLPDIVSQYYLLYRYGIMPAKMAVDDLFKALSRESTRFETVRVGDSTTYDLPVGWTGDAKVSAHAVWKGRFTSQSKKRFSLYLPTTAYELIPFSFVADWFVNLGDLIAASRPMPSVQSNSCVSVKTVISAVEKQRISVSSVNNLSLSASFRYRDFYPDVDAKDASLILTKKARAILPAVFAEDIEVGSFKHESLRRGAGTWGISLNLDLTMYQQLDALALLWATQSKRIRLR